MLATSHLLPILYGTDQSAWVYALSITICDFLFLYHAHSSPQQTTLMTYTSKAALSCKKAPFWGLDYKNLYFPPFLTKKNPKIYIMAYAEFEWL